MSAYIDVTKKIGISIRNCVAPGPVRKLPGIACRAIRSCVPGDRELRGPASGIRIRNCVAYGKEKGYKKKGNNKITNGEIMLSPEPAEETRVRSRHGSPRGVCAAAAWA